MKKILLLLAVGLAAAGSLAAQEVQGVCGTTFEDQLQTEHILLENLASVEAGLVKERGAVQYVPVYFHLVGDANGQGKLRERFVLDQLCALNEAYEGAEIRFYLSKHPVKGTIFNYDINNNSVYENQSAWLTMHNNRHPNAVNIFVVNDAGSDGSSGLTLGYNDRQRDWLVIRKDRINGSTSNLVLPHEAGHFFSLEHTFFGWEGAPFQSTSPGWPIAPATSPWGVATERVNGTNCNSAADKICDTPPDYNFGLGSIDCDYTGGAKDPNGVSVDPMENNFMGYFVQCTSYVFTPQQNNVIRADLNSSRRNYLDNNYNPPATSITAPANMLITPAQAENVPYYDEVLFAWNSVPGATYYLLEVDIITSYQSPFSKSFIIQDTSRLVTDLQPNRNYFWRVRPLNEYVTCAAPRQSTFKTSTTSAVRTIAGLTDWQIAPNPVRDGAPLRLFVNAENSFEANIRVVDAAGRQVYEQLGVAFPSGEQTVNLTLGNLQNGVYFVLMQNSQGQAVRKLSVLR